MVILLHGLGRTSRSMRTMEKNLVQHGYRPVNINYPSTAHPVETLADCVAQQIRQACPAEEVKIHFVTHSLGGIIVRYLHKKGLVNNIGRVVMLCPPNRGSELVDFFSKSVFFRSGYGPAGRQLGTGPDSLPNRLGPVDFEVGVIAGTRSLNPLYSYLIPGRDDGKVSVDRSGVAGMADFITVPHTHTFIMNSPEVVRQTLFFLKNGGFQT